MCGLSGIWADLSILCFYLLYPVVLWELGFSLESPSKLSHSYIDLSYFHFTLSVLAIVLAIQDGSSQLLLQPACLPTMMVMGSI